MTGIGEGNPDMGIELLAICNVLMFVAVMVITIRIICRFWILETEGLDDWCSLIATGCGRSNACKIQLRLATQILYTIASTLIKISILLLYRRIFPNLRLYIFITIGFLTAMSIAFIFAAIFQCNPVSRLWSPSEGLKRLSCFPPLAFWCDVSAIFLATDVWIMALPSPIIFRLQLSLKKKLSVMGLFCLGIFACGAAVARMVYVIKLYVGHDPSWDIVPVYICSIVEISLALIACSVPPLRPAVLLLAEKLPCYKRKRISDAESPPVT
ncbi:hypothetical protein BDV59DRAFT_211022 [Aspergillus ambiguus]|uniref:uncharacterized protein n=1 Tax=Aspergillus ambiguus TaxID=176160 RepID=UPI003CCD99A7